MFQALDAGFLLVFSSTVACLGYIGGSYSPRDWHAFRDPARVITFVMLVFLQTAVVYLGYGLRR